MDPLKDHQLLDSTRYPFGKIRETWFLQNGQANHNSPFRKSTWIVEQAVDENGNQVVIPFDTTFEQKAMDGSKHMIHWRDTFVNLFPFPDEFFVLPLNCRGL